MVPNFCFKVKMLIFSPDGSGILWPRGLGPQIQWTAGAMFPINANILAPKK